jgi:hypothetical protein
MKMPEWELPQQMNRGMTWKMARERRQWNCHVISMEFEIESLSRENNAIANQKRQASSITEVKTSLRSLEAQKYLGQP